ncbi:MAG: 2-C-methyl-D-erythritol 4-phosphate cytidylyltransferase [Bacilli bacterium]|nr:2-C-methyl-D-erythritol 4-phosphate cytidylyltransferase [Bacilli bacterium]
MGLNLNECIKCGSTKIVTLSIDKGGYICSNCRTTEPIIDEKVLSDIPRKDFLYLGQTPQTFNIKELMDTYNTLTDDEKKILTDACKIFVVKNKQVGFVRGEEYNLKITTMHDLKLADAILEVGLNHD